VDMLFSYNMHSRCLADLTETPSIIIFKAFNQVLHLGPTIEDSISIVSNHSHEELTKFIISSLQTIGRPEGDFISGAFTAFRSTQRENGTEYLPAFAGSITHAYLSYFFSRSYLVKKEKIHLDAKSLDQVLAAVPKHYIQSYCKNEKEKMTDLLKNILQTLRILKQIHGSSDQQKSFLAP